MKFRLLKLYEVVTTASFLALFAIGQYLSSIDLDTETTELWRGTTGYSIAVTDTSGNAEMFVYVPVSLDSVLTASTQSSSAIMYYLMHEPEEYEVVITDDGYIHFDERKE